MSPQFVVPVRRRGRRYRYVSRGWRASIVVGSAVLAMCCVSCAWVIYIVLDASWKGWSLYDAVFFGGPIPFSLRLVYLLSQRTELVVGSKSAVMRRTVGGCTTNMLRVPLKAVRLAVVNVTYMQIGYRTGVLRNTGAAVIVTLADDDALVVAAAESEESLGSPLREAEQIMGRRATRRPDV